MLSPLPRQVRETKSLITNPSTSAFPKFRMGRLLHYGFRGLLSVHSRYGLQTRRVALCDPLHRRLRRLCYLHRRSDCCRVERSSSRAGLSPAVDQRLFTAHRKISISLKMPAGGFMVRFPVPPFASLTTDAALRAGVGVRSSIEQRPRTSAVSLQWANNSIRTGSKL